MAFPQRRHLGNLYQLIFFWVGLHNGWKVGELGPHFPQEVFLGKLWLNFLTFHPLCDLVKFYILGENKQVLNWWFNFPWKICLFPKEMWHSYEINAFVFFFFFCFFGFFSQIFSLGRRVKFLSMGKWCQIPKGWAFIHFLNNSSEVGEWINDNF